MEPGPVSSKSNSFDFWTVAKAGIAGYCFLSCFLTETHLEPQLSVQALPLHICHDQEQELTYILGSQHLFQSNDLGR